MAEEKKNSKSSWSIGLAILIAWSAIWLLLCETTMRYGFADCPRFNCTDCCAYSNILFGNVNLWPAETRGWMENLQAGSFQLWLMGATTLYNNWGIKLGDVLVTMSPAVRKVHKNWTRITTRLSKFKNWVFPRPTVYPLLPQPNFTMPVRKVPCRIKVSTSL